ncbi:MAG: tetratricopeptide repeat protein [Nitrospiraceae bacterium]
MLLWLLAGGCAEEFQHRELPPAASDLVLMKSASVCERKAEFLKANPTLPIQTVPWGGGEELRIPAAQSASRAEESYFFNEEGLLVGALFTFPSGLDLKPYPVLRQTLEALKPDVEFYMSLAQAPNRANLDFSTLYRTGDEKSTTQYITLGPHDSSSLLMASVAIDTYESLLSPYRKEFLSRVAFASKGKGGKADVRGAEDKEPFASLQQFARGETAQLSYCGTGDPVVAAAAYGKAIATGFTDKAMLSEAHHKLGLALKRQGQIEKARDAMLQSLSIYPNRPDVLNNLGDVYRAMGDQKKALEAFQRAVTLRPNYPAARFNLAQSYETINQKRAVTEYQTYMALGEGIPEEQERFAQAKKRVEELTKR